MLFLIFLDDFVLFRNSQMQNSKTPHKACHIRRPLWWFWSRLLLPLWISMTFILVKVTLESISLYISYLTVNILLYFGLAEYMEMKLIMPKKKINTQSHTQYVWYTEVVLDVNRRSSVHLSSRAGFLHTLSEVLPSLLKASTACYLPLEILYSEKNPKKKQVLSTSTAESSL